MNKPIYGYKNHLCKEKQKKNKTCKLEWRIKRWFCNIYICKSPELHDKKRAKRQEEHVIYYGYVYELFAKQTVPEYSLLLIL